MIAQCTIITTNNINSVVGDLAQEILDRQQADQGIQDALDLFQDEVIFEINNIEFGIGLDPDGTYQAPESNYLGDTLICLLSIKNFLG